MNKFLTEGVAKYRFLIFFIFIYFLLAWIHTYKADFVAEEVVPFLPFSPKIVCDINDAGANIYSVHHKGLSPDKFAGRINYIGHIKTIVNHFILGSYIWETPNGLRLPVMKNEGSGSLYYYIHKIFFRDEYRFDLLKKHMIFIGVLILLVMWFFLKDFFDIKVANLSLILLSTSRLFVGRISYLWFSDNYHLLFMFLIISLLWKYIKSNKLKYLYLCAFTVGVALYIKFTVLWLLVTLSVLFIYYRPRVNIRFRHIVNCCFLIMLGSLPMIIYNIDSGGGTLIGIKSRFLGGVLIDHRHHILLSIKENLLYFLDLFYDNLPECIFLTFTFFIYLFIKLKYRIKDTFYKRVGFLWALNFLMLMFILCSAYNMGSNYYLNFYIFSIMAQVATLGFILHMGLNKYKTMVYASIAVFVGVYIFVSLSQPIFHFYSSKQQPLTASESLVEYIFNENIHDPVTFDFDTIGYIEFLSKGKIRPLHYYQMLDGVEDKNIRRKILKKIILNNPKKFFIARRKTYRHASLSHIFYEDFVKLNQSGSLSLCLKKLIYDRLRKCVYIIMKVADNDCTGLLETQPAEFMEKFK